MIEIQELTSHEEFREAFPVMRELRTRLDEAAYLSLLEKMIPEGYRLFALRNSGKIVALAGIAILTNFYYDRYVYVYDLITATEARSRGFGRHLLAFIESFARQENCETIALSSGLQRADAHRFYEHYMHYKKSSYVFQKHFR